MENFSLLTVKSCMDSSANPDTASAAVEAPLEAYVHTDRQMHIRLVSTLTRGGGGSMPALMPCTIWASMRCSPHRSRRAWTSLTARMLSCTPEAVKQNRRTFDVMKP